MANRYDDDPNMPRRRQRTVALRRERLLASTPEQRDRAMARVRVAQAAFAEVAPRYRDAHRERDAAMLAANEAGLSVRRLAREVGLPLSNVARMIARARGDDVTRRANRARARREQEST